MVGCTPPLISGYDGNRTKNPARGGDDSFSLVCVPDSPRSRVEKQDDIALLDYPSNDQPVQTVAGDNRATVEKWIDAPGPNENVEIVIHFFIG